MDLGEVIELSELSVSSSALLLSSLLGGEAGLAIGILLNFLLPDLAAAAAAAEALLAPVSRALAPMTLAPMGFPVGCVTSLAVMMTFWLGPGGPSVLSLTDTPNELPPLCRGMKYVVSEVPELLASFLACAFSCLASSSGIGMLLSAAIAAADDDAAPDELSGPAAGLSFFLGFFSGLACTPAEEDEEADFRLYDGTEDDAVGSGSSNAYGLASLSTLNEAAPAPADLEGEEKMDLGLAGDCAEVEGLCDAFCGCCWLRCCCCCLIRCCCCSTNCCWSCCCLSLCWCCCCCWCRRFTACGNCCC